MINQQIETISEFNNTSPDIFNKKYSKLTPEVKQQFIHKIVFENFSIKEAAEALKINYSSAKAIIALHKKGNMAPSTIKKGLNICSYKENVHTLKNSIQICSMIGGISTERMIAPKRKLIKKIMSDLTSIRSTMDDSKSE